MAFSKALLLASSAIRRGGVIAYPCETVYGLGCDPFNKCAILDLLNIKQRDVEKGLIVLFASTSDLFDVFSQLNNKQQSLIKSTTQATTWLIEDTQAVFPKHIKGAHSNVAVRITSHPFLINLINQLQHPLTSTSANFSGQPLLKNNIQIHKTFNHLVDYIVPGEITLPAKPSQIIDLDSGIIVRKH